MLKRFNIIWLFISVALIFILTGLFLGEPKVLLEKAITVCLSCMGIAK